MEEVDYVRCGNCRYRSDAFTSACTCGESPRRADFVNADDWCYCFYWTDDVYENVILKMDRDTFMNAMARGYSKKYGMSLEEAQNMLAAAKEDVDSGVVDMIIEKLTKRNKNQ